MLSVRDLKTHTLNGASLDVAPGEAVAILGRSGAGKSLLLRAIADLDPNDGKVSLNGVDRDTIPAPRWRRRVGYLAAESGWWSDVVGDHFRDREKAIPLVGELGFDKDVFSWSIDRLSTGEKQRLGLARLLLGDPLVLLLDEPTGALDKDSVTLVETLLAKRQADGAAILFVTHDREQAGRMADRRLWIENGKLVPHEEKADD